ncbi:O-antigen ligase family protein [Niabella sp.]|uniref:O-antigen ligase family protein n=1 Tax=Niabella sp. TaxID=1962976 RepID=UPI00260BF6FE|nr:O-antigen ligase family protein [Niabella sp.]
MYTVAENRFISKKARKLKADRKFIFLMFLLLPVMAYFNIDAKYTVVSLLFVAVFCYYYKNAGFKHIALSRGLMIWLLLTVYHWVNGMIKKVPEVDLLDLLHGFKIYACIVIFAYLARRSFQATIKALLVCFSVYLLLSFVVNDISSSSLHGRMSGVIYSTQLGQTAALLGIYIAYYSVSKRLSLLQSACLYVLPLVVILLAQSRNGLAMMAIGIVGHAIAYAVQKGAKLAQTLVIVTLLTLLMFAAFNFVIDNTAIGSRLADTDTAEMSNMNNNHLTNTVFDKIAGDRLVYYVLGWQFFVQSPWTGIGMWNFKYLSNGDYPLHSEYMIHLCEGGIIAAILWLLFIITIIRGLLYSKQKLSIKIIAFFSILEILFCGLYARVFYYEFFYPVIGIAISLAYYNGSRRHKYSNRSLSYPGGDLPDPFKNIIHE